MLVQKGKLIIPLKPIMDKVYVKISNNVSTMEARFISFVTYSEVKELVQDMVSECFYSRRDDKVMMKSFADKFENFISLITGRVGFFNVRTPDILHDILFNYLQIMVENHLDKYLSEYDNSKLEWVFVKDTLEVT